MEMRRCDKGHFYDAKRFSTCPYCSGDSDSMNLTRPIDIGGANTGDNGDISKTRPIGMSVSANAYHEHEEQEKTVALIKKDTGIDPVVGWLVCVEGGDKGKDYRIHGERNFIGRSEKMDICIHGDDTISRDNHAIISYDIRKNVFRLYEGDSKGIVYLNDEEVVTAAVLKSYDVIEVGQTKLIFIPFCEERFRWK